MKNFFLFFLFLPLLSKSQNHSLDSIKAPAAFDNIYSKEITSDSLSSSFIIFIKKEVKKHKHAVHTENVYILEGEGQMILGTRTITIKSGDIIFIPKNTVHSLKVTSKIPLKVLSIQSPYFDGKDRIFVE